MLDILTIILCPEKWTVHETICNIDQLKKQMLCNDYNVTFIWSIDVTATCSLPYSIIDFLAVIICLSVKILFCLTHGDLTWLLS